VCIKIYYHCGISLENNYYFRHIHVVFLFLTVLYLRHWTDMTIDQQKGLCPKAELSFWGEWSLSSTTTRLNLVDRAVLLHICNIPSHWGSTYFHISRKSIGYVEWEMVCVCTKDWCRGDSTLLLWCVTCRCREVFTVSLSTILCTIA
jgi:hypothetical protein